MDLIRLDIIGVSDSLSSGGAYLLVLGEVDGNRRLPIVIGSQEAQAINMARKGSKPPRPLTHDILCDVFEEVGSEVLDVVIDDLREGTFFAKIRFVHGGKERYLDSRPSDAVALAVRMPVAIFVVPSILDEAGIPVEETNGDTLTEEVIEPQLSRVEKMEKRLSRAIQEEHYEEAARLRDELLQLKGEQT